MDISRVSFLEAKQLAFSEAADDDDDHHDDDGNHADHCDSDDGVHARQTPVRRRLVGVFRKQGDITRKHVQPA